MSVYLIVTLSIILLGAAITALLAWRQPRFAPLAAGLTLCLTLLTWLVAGQNLPLTAAEGPESPASQLLLHSWQVAQPGWQLSFFLLLLMTSVVVTSLAHTDLQEWRKDRPARVKAQYPAILLVSAAALLTVWASTVASMLVTWVILSLVWLMLLWAMSVDSVRGGTLLRRAGALLLGVLLIWLAVAAFEGQGTVLDGTATGSAAFLLLFAAMTPLGAVPFQWWRPLAWSLPLETAAIVHLVPVVAGGALLVRVAGPTGVGEPSLLLVATLFGLTGMLFGISIAWMYVASPARALSGLALAQAGVVILAAVWVGSQATLAATRVFLLGIGGLFLAARWTPRKLPWPAILPLLALAGFPLTAGVDGLATVYNAWLINGRAALLIIGAALSMFLLAVGVLVVRREMPPSGLIDRRLEVRAWHALALALPSLGLLAWPNRSLSEIELWAFVAVIVAIAGGLALSRFESQIQDGQLSLRRALHLGFAGRRSLRLLADIGFAVDSFIREAAAILEGEGGMLWLLVFLVVIWLARR